MVISKKKSKFRATFDKNRNVSYHMAEYCHNSRPKCPLFVRAKMSMPLASWFVNDPWVWSIHAKHAKNAASVSSVHNTCLDKIKSSAIYKEYLTGTGNWNNKQISKLTTLKLGVWWKSNECYIFVCTTKLELLNFANQCGNTHMEVWWEVLHGICWKFTSLSSSERMLKIC